MPWNLSWPGSPWRSRAHRLAAVLSSQVSEQAGCKPQRVNAPSPTPGTALIRAGWVLGYTYPSSLVPRVEPPKSNLHSFPDGPAERHPCCPQWYPTPECILYWLSSPLTSPFLFHFLDLLLNKGLPSKSLPRGLLWGEPRLSVSRCQPGWASQRNPMIIQETHKGDERGQALR